MHACDGDLSLMFLFPSCVSWLTESSFCGVSCCWFCCAHYHLKLCSGVHLECECPMCSLFMFIAVLQRCGSMESTTAQYTFVQITPSIVYLKKSEPNKADEQIAYRWNEQCCARACFFFQHSSFSSLS